jgi:hypothetical protein
VYARADGDQFYAIDPATGRGKWSRDDGVMVLGEMGNSVWVLTDTNELVVVDAAIGTEGPRVAMGDLNLFVPNAAGTVVYAASRDGLICCIRPAGDGHVTAEMITTAAEK